MRGHTGIAFVTAVLMLAALPGHAAESPARTDYGRLFDALWSTVNDHFYDPGFRGVDWKAVGTQYRRQLADVHTDHQFETLAGRMLDTLGTSHLYVEPPSRSTAAGVGIGVRFRTIEGWTLVSSLDPLSDAHNKGLHPGDLLLSPRSEIDGPLGTLAALKFQTCTGELRSVHIAREESAWPPQHPGFEWHEVTLSPHLTVGYIRIDRFDDGAAELADRAMQELKGTGALIIDLRANSGGNLSAARLASYFISGPPRVAVALFSRGYLKKLGHEVTAADVASAPRVTGAYTTDAIQAAISAHAGGAVFMTDDVGNERYTKPVIVLVGGFTGSAAEGFAWMMHDYTKATLVGRKTAGALLSAVPFDLPGGWRVTVPVQGVWGTDGTDYRDRAVSPDVVVKWTRSDLCSGRDPDIVEALKLLEGSSVPGHGR